jgi:hypothetical protein
MFEHKEGCLGDPPGCAHRSPIECTTREGLEKYIEKQRVEISNLSNQLIGLKAKLYDLEHEANY